MPVRRPVDVEVRSKVFLITGGIVLLLCLVPWFDHRNADTAVVQDAMLQSPDRLYVVRSETLPISPEPSQLSAQGTATAEAVSLLPRENGVRLEITDGGSEDWQIGWNACYLDVEPGTPLTLRFTARATEDRPIRCELSQNHEPWQALGLNQSFELTPDWKTYEAHFKTTSSSGATTERARLCFDVGGAPISVELRDISLERSADRRRQRAASIFESASEQPIRERSKTWWGRVPPVSATAIVSCNKHHRVRFREHCSSEIFCPGDQTEVGCCIALDFGSAEEKKH